MADFKENVEIERKYIIAMPTVAELAKLEGYSESRILQTYLCSDEGVTRRVRRREFAGEIKHYETLKARIDRVSAVEREREISAEEYELLLAEIADGTRTIEKTRYTFPYRGHVVEIDVYPEWKRTAILETELPTRDEVAELPAFIKVIREVSGIKGYSNAAMSRSFPPEDEI